MNECLVEVEEVEKNTKEICGLVGNFRMMFSHVEIELMRQELQGIVIYLDNHSEIENIQNTFRQ